MIRRALTIASFVGIFVVGCAPTGDDVWLSKPEAPTCRARLGENVCTLFKNAPPEALEAAGMATAFAGRARNGTDGIANACEGIVRKLEGDVAAAPEGEEPRQRMERVCSVATELLAAKLPRGATFSFAPPACRPLTLPTCVAPEVGFFTCDTPQIEMKLPDGASDTDKEIALVFETRYPAAVALLQETKILLGLAIRLSKLAPALAELPNECAKPMVDMVSTAIAEVSASAAVGAKMQQAGLRSGPQ